MYHVLHDLCWRNLRTGGLGAEATQKSRGFGAAAVVLCQLLNTSTSSYDASDGLLGLDDWGRVCRKEI